MKVNCFAYDPSKEKCKAMTNNCNDDCVFYKSPDEHKEGRLKNHRRLATLPREQQKCIADKYYAGKMPWQETPMTKRKL